MSLEAELPDDYDNDFMDDAPEAQRSAVETFLPHSVEAEQSVIGGLMLDNSRFDAVAEFVTVEDFYKDDHRQIFKVMVELATESKPLDIVTLAEALERHGELDRIGGHGYLAEMASHTPSAANITSYAKIVRDHSTVRQLISAANEISRSSLNPAGLDSAALLQLAERRVAEIVEDRPKEGGFLEVDGLLKGAIKRIEELFDSDDDLTGLSTGLRDLDERTSGWQNGELIVLAARPSMGKTALALNFVESAILNQDMPVLVFSMEMPAQSLVMRMLSSIGRIHQGKMRNGKLTEEDWPKLSAAVGKMKGRPLFIDDTPGLTPQDIKARARRIAREHGEPAMIVIDYIQLMHVAGSTEGRTQEISEISRSLKAIAKEYNCPVIALSQLNRGVEQRPNKRPMNSDLRESGAIEQDADIVLFIYRDEYYNEESPDKGIAELIIGKQRNGEIGTSRAAFVGHFTRFENLAPEYFSDEY
ncbi:replicative DNA helicase [Aurantivibrio infirmus]